MPARLPGVIGRIDAVGLTGRNGDRYKSYSLGMKQRLAIAATLLKRPELLSSHILVEVQQVCTSVTIIGRGRMLASGPVDELVGSSTVYRVDCASPEEARRVLTGAGFTGAGFTVHDGLHVETIDPASITRPLTARSPPRLGGNEACLGGSTADPRCRESGARGAVGAFDSGGVRSDAAQ